MGFCISWNFQASSDPQQTDCLANRLKPGIKVRSGVFTTGCILKQGTALKASTKNDRLVPLLFQQLLGCRKFVKPLFHPSPNSKTNTAEPGALRCLKKILRYWLQSARLGASRSFLLFLLDPNFVWDIIPFSVRYSDFRLQEFNCPMQSMHRCL